MPSLVDGFAVVAQHDATGEVIGVNPESPFKQGAELQILITDTPYLSSVISTKLGELEKSGKN